MITEEAILSGGHLVHLPTDKLEEHFDEQKQVWTTSYNNHNFEWHGGIWMEV